MAVVTANDLKTKGGSDIERLLQDNQAVVISMRGKPRYVVMDIATCGRGYWVVEWRQ